MAKFGVKDHKSKTNKYDNLSKPQAEFDFHGMKILTMSGVREMADEFIGKCKDRGLTKVLFVTGKGLHSKGGMPIIKPFLKKYLLEKSFVERVYEGRIDRGGSGTLEVIFKFI